MKYPIDLGRKSGEMAVMSDPSSEKFYPTLHLEWKKEYEFPDSGMMLVKFNKTGESKSTHNGETNYNVTLEIKSIEKVDEIESEDEDDEPKEKEESTGDRLDKMAKEASGDY